MARKRLNSEERHKKQKERLERGGASLDAGSKSAYIPEPNLKSKVVEEAVNAGFKCELDLNSVVIFAHNDKESAERWLYDKYAKDETTTRAGKEVIVKRIPFSYGFC